MFSIATRFSAVVISVGLLGLEGGRATSADSRSEPHIKAGVTAAPSKPNMHALHSPPTIDGALTPELIPDIVAQRLLMSSLKGQIGPANSRRSRTLRIFSNDGCGVMGSHSPPVDKPELLKSVSEAAAIVLAAADAYHARVSILDSRRDQESSPLVERERLVIDTMESLRLALGPEAAAAMDCYVSTVIKPRTRYFASSVDRLH